MKAEINSSNGTYQLHFERVKSISARSRLAIVPYEY
jgi:hypothetical protein